MSHAVDLDLAPFPRPDRAVSLPLRGLQRAQVAFGGRHYADLIVAEVDGGVRADELRRAVAALVDRHPTLRARLDVGRRRVTWSDTLGDGLPIGLRVGDWRVAAEELLGAPLGDDRLPWRIEAVAHDGGVHLLLAVHHALVDGRALSALMRDLLAALDDPTALGPGLARPPSALALARPAAWMGWATGLVRAAWTWRARGVQRRAVLPGRRLAAGEVVPTRFAARALPAALVRDLRREAGLHGATVGTALAEAAARATEGLIARRGGPPGARFDVEAMVDVRPLLPDAPDVGMYAGGVLAVRAGADPRTPWARARAAHARVRRQLAWGVPLLAHTVFDGVVDPAGDVARRGLDLDAAGGAGAVTQVSNVGVWDGPLRFGRRRLRAVWSATSAVRAGPALLVWLRTVDGEGCLSAIANGAVLTDAQLDGWIDELALHLATLADR